MWRPPSYAGPRRASAAIWTSPGAGLDRRLALPGDAAPSTAGRIATNARAPQPDARDSERFRHVRTSLSTQANGHQRGVAGTRTLDFDGKLYTFNTAGERRPFKPLDAKRFRLLTRSHATSIFCKKTSAPSHHGRRRTSTHQQLDAALWAASGAALVGRLGASSDALATINARRRKHDRPARRPGHVRCLPSGTTHRPRRESRPRYQLWARAPVLPIPLMLVSTRYNPCRAISPLRRESVWPDTFATPGRRRGT
ncbi:hypothetical protein PsYK624_059430 [Phanerochaete sordida]|uniref:Uncharacterized protein n=1 Tax=Phanerochaete sordida TaxID=48140 RepID=A0A9P3G8M5_9APHY|nr:hypothetical protein PsYK624_059430 [Phanerochaete sordida]